MFTTVQSSANRKRRYYQLRLHMALILTNDDSLFSVPVLCLGWAFGNFR
jgi:hypothetical protein